MALQLLRCSRCGGELVKIDDLFKCNFCHATFKDEYANQDKILMDTFDQVKQERIAALRSLQWKAVNATYLSNNDIVDASKKILEFLPDDFISQFYIVACGNNLVKINHFLDNIDVIKREAYVTDVVKYMLKVAESANILSLESLIDRGIKDENQVKYLNEVHELAEKLDYGIYDTEVPRDVFVAYSSKDYKVVNEVVNNLESNGISCFVAIRNLRHGKGAVENYNQELYKAMHNCEIFVLISTKNSRQPSCDAIRVEMPYFRDKESDKPRIEYVVDNIRENVAVEMKLKKFFGEKEYCRTIEDLLGRIMDLMEVKPEAKEEEEYKYCINCLEAVSMDQKFCGKCGGADFALTFDSAKELYTKKLLLKKEQEQSGIRSKLIKEEVKPQEQPSFRSKLVKEEVKPQEQTSFGPRLVKEEPKRVEEQSNFEEQPIMPNINFGKSIYDDGYDNRYQQNVINEPKPEKNKMAIVAAITAFIVPYISWIFGIAGLKKAKQMGGKGKTRSILGIFSAIWYAFILILVATGAVSTLSIFGVFIVGPIIFAAIVLIPKIKDYLSKIKK